MSVYQSAPSYDVHCTGCLKVFLTPDIVWKPLRSATSGLYFPGEPFCSHECYEEFTANTNHQFRKPTKEQMDAFRKTLTP